MERDTPSPSRVECAVGALLAQPSNSAAFSFGRSLAAFGRGRIHPLAMELAAARRGVGSPLGGTR